MAKGYLNDEDRTKSSFIHSVSFLPEPSQGETRKFYKTGDLARYNANGTMEYLGRLDTQVKVRGYRIELGEVEYSIQKSLPNAEHVAVDVVRLDSRELLAAFISFNESDGANRKDSDSPSGPSLLDMDDGLLSSLTRVDSDLRAMLPSYMVPSVFIPLTTMPFNTSLKMDRQKLRSMVLDLADDDLATYSLSNREWVAPSTDMELKLRSLWAEVLHVDENSIGKHDNFLQIGGDSITAIQVVNAAQKEHITLTVNQVFTDPRLSHLATAASNGKAVDSFVTDKFGLIPRESVDHVTNLAREKCKLSDEQDIEDLYPGTPLQEGLMALTMRQPGSYVAKTVFKLPEYVSDEKFIKAWEKTVAACSNLRTRIVLINDSLCRLWSLVKCPGNQLVAVLSTT